MLNKRDSVDYQNYQTKEELPKVNSKKSIGQTQREPIQPEFRIKTKRQPSKVYEPIETPKEEPIVMSRKSKRENEKNRTVVISKESARSKAKRESNQQSAMMSKESARSKSKKETMSVSAYATK